MVRRRSPELGLRRAVADACPSLSTNLPPTEADCGGYIWSARRPCISAAEFGVRAPCVPARRRPADLGRGRDCCDGWGFGGAADAWAPSPSPGASLDAGAELPSSAAAEAHACPPPPAGPAGPGVFEVKPPAPELSLPGSRVVAPGAPLPLDEGPGPSAAARTPPPSLPAPLAPLPLAPMPLLMPLRAVVHGLKSGDVESGDVESGDVEDVAVGDAPSAEARAHWEGLAGKGSAASPPAAWRWCGREDVGGCGGSGAGPGPRGGRACGRGGRGASRRTAASAEVLGRTYCAPPVPESPLCSAALPLPLPPPARVPASAADVLGREFVCAGRFLRRKVEEGRACGAAKRADPEP
mmetsp:Transcript_5789/g.17230  ORF Transcript_5789/g.17230 Transcript_5789/m.17230 type:complete len:353 (+) Transcript_5789:284-1342(+)